MVEFILAILWIAIGLAKEDGKPGLLLAILTFFLIAAIKASI